ncbi:ankyrin repeat protein [Colletotrichum musicola]|uniref:Ankyrin repeat protein n=1 Tax=Colletotrichum musicola TaxID=2175873 RepID=A0A8H6NA03_9PEZI|nr:ankyrin repeat protein [Colletotrichum musicola]
MGSSSGQPPEFWIAVEPYLEHGDREYLATILRPWSPTVDPDNHIAEALHNAIWKCDDVAVRMMLEAGVNPRARQSCDPNFTPILAASQYGSLEIVRLLWEIVGPDGRFFPSRRRPSRLNCLQVAARNGHAELVDFFLGVWNGWEEDEKCSALRDAASAWCDDVVALLLTEVRYQDETIQDAMGMAVMNKMILPEAENRPRNTPGDDVQQERVVCLLINAGADLNGRSRFSQRPLLHVASQTDHCIGGVRGLLANGAVPNRQDRDGRTALHLAPRGEGTPVPESTLACLLQAGASAEIKDVDGETPLHTVAKTGTLEQFRLCLASCGDSNAAIHVENLFGESLLHYAAAGGKVDIIELLLDLGADINSVNGNGWTPLICALAPTRAKHEDAIYSSANLLLQRGTNAGIVTDEGWTPLHALVTYPFSFRWSSRSPESTAAGVLLARKLISSGAVVDAESSVIQRLSVSGQLLCDKWGFRMRRFMEKTAKRTPDLDSIETTPLVWALKNNAIDIFDVIREHFDSAALDGKRL